MTHKTLTPVPRRKNTSQWIKAGLWFGYPKCCITQFIGDDIPGRNRDVSYGGFIPCDGCAQRIRDKEITIEDLIQNRVEPKPFPKYTRFKEVINTEAWKALPTTL